MIIDQRRWSTCKSQARIRAKTMTCRDRESRTIRDVTTCRREIVTTDVMTPGVETQSGGNQGEQTKKECVPYLGWKIRGLLADVTKWPKEGDDGDEADSR